MRGVVTALLATTLSILPVRAAEEFVEGCYRRDYDEAHLAAHPDQTVVGISLELAYDGEPLVPAFELAVRLRGREDWISAGGACHLDDAGWRCSVVCDGGGVGINYREDGRSVLVSLKEPYGYIRLSYCGQDDEVGFSLDAGLDDKTFVLTQSSC